MKKTLIGLLGSTVICVLFLAGCIDEHYGEDSNTIVTNLTGYAWERTFQVMLIARFLFYSKPDIPTGDLHKSLDIFPFSFPPLMCVKN